MADLVAQRRAILRKFHGGGAGARVVTRTIAGRQVAVSLETGTVVGTAGLTPSQFEAQQREFQRTGKIVPETTTVARKQISRLDTKIRETARTEIQRQRERGIKPVLTSVISLAKKITKKAEPTKKRLLDMSLIEQARQEQRLARQFFPADVPKKTIKLAATIAVTGIAGGVARGVISGGLAIVATARNPVRAAKETFQALRPKNFVQTAKVMGREFTVDPVKVITEFYTFSKVLSLGGRAIKRSPVGRFVQEEVFIRTQPREIRPAVRKIVKASKIQERLNPTKLRDLRRVDFMEVKSLTPLEAAAIKKTLRQTDSVVFGSTAARAAAGKFRSKLPKPKDVDIATKSVADFSKKFINNLPKSTQRNYIIRGEKVVRRNTGQRLFDVKPLNRLIPDRSIITRQGFLPVSGYVRRLKVDLFPKFKIVRGREKVKGIYVGVNRGKFPQLNISFPKITLKKPKGKLLPELKLTKGPEGFVLNIKLPRKDITPDVIIKKARLELIKGKFPELIIKETLKNLKILLIKKPKGIRIVRKPEVGILEVPTRKLVKIEKRKILIKLKRDKIIPRLKVKITKPIKIIGFGEQTARKGLGTLQVLIEKNVRRAKDPQAFVISLEVQIEALKRAKPKTAIGRLRNKRRIRILSDAVKLLKSKAFARLLERKVTGITKQFPLVAKINTSRLKKINLKRVKEAVRQRVARLVKKKKILPRKPPKKVPPKRIPPSEIPISSVLKAPSKAPSIIPRVIAISRIPTKIPRRPTRVPTKLPPSKVPVSKLFKIPSKLPIVPTVIPISRLPRRPPTRLPPTKIPRVPISKLPKIVRKKLIKEKKLKKLLEKKRKELAKLTEKVLPQQVFIYIPDLYSRVFGVKARPKERAAFLRAGRVFTGIESRPLIPARLIRRKR